MKNIINYKYALAGETNSKFRKIKLLMVGCLFLFSFVTIGYRTISLAGIHKSSPENISIKATKENIIENLPRGNIYDRNNNLLATTIATSSLNINPHEIFNKSETIKKLIDYLSSTRRKQFKKQIKLK